MLSVEEMEAIRLSDVERLDQAYGGRGWLVGADARRRARLQAARDEVLDTLVGTGLLALDGLTQVLLLLGVERSHVTRELVAELTEQLERVSERNAEEHRKEDRHEGRGVDRAVLRQGHHLRHGRH